MTAPEDGDRPDSPLHTVDSDAHVGRLDEDEPAALVVVRTVARVLGRPPLDLDPLSAQVDPEALDDLVGGPVGRREGLTVSFRYEGCVVVVTPTQVEVSPEDEDDAE